MMVLTDLARTTPQTVNEDHPVDEARQMMVSGGMIQTPLHKTPTLTMETLASLTIGNLIRTLKSFGEQHMLVTEPTSHKGVRIRGMISAADIGRVIGYGPRGMPEARSFADICKVVIGH
ncbi:hypothetical protein [Halomonas aquatica]|uniref:CBS domain-containing protein n=1 Tax=Halomonas aquatica TaxID=3151123 RepID=A0ABV1NIC4_9GAMM